MANLTRFTCGRHQSTLLSNPPLPSGIFAAVKWYNGVPVMSSESRDELNNTLASLHETLNETSNVDAKTRELLMSLTGDIQRLLEDDGATVEHDDSLTERIADISRDFGANHPMIGRLLQRLSAGLANLGI